MCHHHVPLKVLFINYLLRIFIKNARFELHMLVEGSNNSAFLAFFKSQNSTDYSITEINGLNLKGSITVHGTWDLTKNTTRTFWICKNFGTELERYLISQKFWKFSKEAYSVPCHPACIPLTKLKKVKWERVDANLLI